MSVIFLRLRIVAATFTRLIFPFKFYKFEKITNI